MKPLVSDALWERVEPLLPPPPERRFRFPGRKPLDQRRIVTGILFVLKTGIAWDDLPAELGCGCGKTCRHHLRLWHELGVWQKLHALLLAELNAADLIDWSRAVIDGTFVKAPEGGEETGPNPTDRGKSGSKHHVLTDANGIPLAVKLTAANVPDVVPAMEVLTAVPPVGGKPGPPREKPDRLQGDRGYDSDPLRKPLRWLGIVPELAARNTEHGSGLGATRWVVERTNAFLHGFGRLRRRLDRLAEFQEAFLAIASSIICIVGGVGSVVAWYSRVGILAQGWTRDGPRLPDRLDRRARGDPRTVAPTRQTRRTTPHRRPAELAGPTAGRHKAWTRPWTARIG